MWEKSDSTLFVLLCLKPGAGNICAYPFASEADFIDASGASSNGCYVPPSSVGICISKSLSAALLLFSLLLCSQGETKGKDHWREW